MTIVIIAVATQIVMMSSPSFLKFIGCLLGFRLTDGNRKELRSILGLAKPASKAIVLAANIQLARVVRLLVAFALLVITEEHTLVRIVVLHGFIWFGLLTEIRSHLDWTALLVRLA